jgi:pilus assembly protein Flp/PilA
MNALVSRMRAFLVSEDGPTATEYAVMLALIIIACLAAVQLLGTKVTQVFTDVEGAIP